MSCTSRLLIGLRREKKQDGQEQQRTGAEQRKADGERGAYVELGLIIRRDIRFRREKAAPNPGEEVGRGAGVANQSAARCRALDGEHRTQGPALLGERLHQRGKSRSASCAGWEGNGQWAPEERLPRRDTTGVITNVSSGRNVADRQRLRQGRCTPTRVFSPASGAPPVGLHIVSIRAAFLGPWPVS